MCSHFACASPMLSLRSNAPQVIMQIYIIQLIYLPFTVHPVWQSPALLIFDTTGISNVCDIQASCRREWLRAIWKPIRQKDVLLENATADLPPQAQLLNFFASFPGRLTLFATIDCKRKIPPPMHSANGSCCFHWWSNTPFTLYQGLRRQVGAILSLYYTPESAARLGHADAAPPNAPSRWKFPQPQKIRDSAMLHSDWWGENKRTNTLSLALTRKQLPISLARDRSYLASLVPIYWKPSPWLV